MKKTGFLLISTCTMLFFASCHNGNTANANGDSTHNDTTTYDITRPTGTNVLEDLLTIKDEAELKNKFGKEAITYDTIWGSEGMYTMGSFINKGKNEVEIIWQDSLHRTGISSLRVVAAMDKDGYYVYDNTWVSKTGIKLGTTTDELEKMNGKPFTFSGFGWDYGGGVGEWKGGKLENCGVGLTLTEGNTQGKCSEKELDDIMGDRTLTSDNAVIKKVQPRVVMMSVSSH